MELNKLTKKLKLYLHHYTLDELVVLVLAASILISIYFTFAAVVLTMSYLIVQNKFKTIIKSVKGSFWILAFCILSFIVSFYCENFLGMIFAFAMLLIFITGMYVRMVMTPALFEKLIDLCIHVSVFCFIVALLEQLIAGINSSYRADSTFLNANYYATFIEFVILFCVYKLLQNPGRKKTLYICAVMIINICGLYLCDCRTAFIILGFTIPVMLLLYKKRKAFTSIVGVSVLAIASLLLFPGLFPRGNNLNSDLSTRLSIWKTAVKGILQNPLFGQGAGTYARIYTKFGGHPAPHAHNIILDPLLNFGLAGSLLLFMYFKENLSAIHKMYTEDIDHPKFNLAFAVILCVILHGMFDAAIFGIQTGFLFILFLGMAGISEKHQIFHQLSFEDFYSIVIGKISKLPNLKKFFIKQ